MKLTALTLDFYPEIGGVQTFLYETLSRLGAAHDIIVVTPVTGALPPAANLRKVELQRGRAAAFWQALRQLRPDRILIGHAHPQLLLAAWLYAPRSYAALTYGNDYLAGQQRWHRPLFNFLLRKSAPLITITEANARRLAGLGLTRPRVIYPGTNPAQFLPAARPSPKTAAPKLLTVCRLVPRKGVDQVLSALPALLSSFPDLTYRVIGEGPDRARLETMAQQLRVAHAVHFLGSVSEDRLKNQYQEADVFVMVNREIAAASSIEGFGIVFLEAAAAGLPVVAGRSGGAAEAVRHGETGFLTPPDDVEALVEILRRLLGDANLRHTLGQNGRSWVETEMNWDRAARELAQALNLP